MKFKTYFIILSVLFILLFYNIFCYKFANKRIDDATHFLISNYLNDKCNCNYKYLKATSNSDGSINVYVKTLENNANYYHFVFTNNNGYNIVLVDSKIPAYFR